MSDVAVEQSQFLTFEIGDEHYAVEVMGVREVLEIGNLTRIPKMPDYMRGVINLRGSVVPVVDLRMKFGMTQTESTLDTRIIVLEVTVMNDEIVIGALADKVNEVIEISRDQIEAAPKIGTRLKNEMIKGVGKRENQFVIILDVEKIFSAEDLEQIIEKRE